MRAHGRTIGRCDYACNWLPRGVALGMHICARMIFFDVCVRQYGNRRRSDGGNGVSGFARGIGQRNHRIFYAAFIRLFLFVALYGDRLAIVAPHFYLGAGLIFFEEILCLLQAIVTKTAVGEVKHIFADTHVFAETQAKVQIRPFAVDLALDFAGSGSGGNRGGIENERQAGDTGEISVFEVLHNKRRGL